MDATSCARRRVACAPLLLRCRHSALSFCTQPRRTRQVTEEFLAYSRQQGNDLVTPRPEYSFPGLRPGDRWCLCAGRWAEALRAGVAPPVVLSACAEASLKHVTLEELQAHALPETQ